mmetsp:Transcript_70189/g.196459  ORF Transcript_70189/g.196459 Transcript_70189/m.196459 type:complete len:301 (+) Transcript_70189:958-1860(+)
MVRIRCLRRRRHRGHAAHPHQQLHRPAEDHDARGGGRGEVAHSGEDRGADPAGRRYEAGARGVVGRYPQLERTTQAEARGPHQRQPAEADGLHPRARARHAAGVRGQGAELQSALPVHLPDRGFGMLPHLVSLDLADHLIHGGRPTRYSLPQRVLPCSRRLLLALWRAIRRAFLVLLARLCHCGPLQSGRSLLLHHPPPHALRKDSDELFPLQLERYRPLRHPSGSVLHLRIRRVRALHDDLDAAGRAGQVPQVPLDLLREQHLRLYHPGPRAPVVRVPLVLPPRQERRGQAAQGQDEGD